MLKKFITIEGGEGCGKSTLCQNLANELSAMNIENIVTREPGGIKASEEIRTVIMENEVELKTEVLLFAAARNEHLKQLIIPALKKDKYVICDRYVDSSLAYQGYAHGLGIDEVLSINEYAINNNLPHLTFWLDMDAKDALNRINSEREVNRFDQKTIEFHEKVREGYQRLYERYPHRIIKLDARKTTEELTKIILEKIIC